MPEIKYYRLKCFNNVLTKLSRFCLIAAQKYIVRIIIDIGKIIYPAGKLIIVKRYVNLSSGKIQKFK